VSDATWSTIGGILTANLYGLPDRVAELRSGCDQIGIPLIEDGAHAIVATVAGRRIGTFGDVAAFSVSKHTHAGVGGSRIRR
jgi:dTDP-4-amino-4,6-dideoxygalactose transaminase